MSLTGSRRSSADDDDSKDFHKKGNPDSGFHEEKENHSSSSSTNVSGTTKTGRRRPKTVDSSGGLGHSGQSRHSISHDSIISEAQVLSQRDEEEFGHSSNKSGCSTSSGVIESDGDSPADISETQNQSQREQQRKNYKKRGKHFPPPKTPPPTAFNGGTNESTLDKTKAVDTVTNYDFPSDTELSEIIAIMSGLATPRNKPPSMSNSYENIQKPQTAGGKFFEHHHNNDDEFQNYRYDDSRHAESMPSIRRSGEDKKESQFHGVGNGVINSNSKIRNGNAGRRYLQKQQWSKSVDAVSVSGSIGGSVSDISYRNKSTPNSLNSILAASGKSGTLGPNGKKRKKKPKYKGPPKKEEEVMSEYSTKPSWKQRLKFFLTFVASVTLILSGSSLLFVVPIVVDPILVGLEAQFSTLPAQCKTISKRNGTGSVECTIPSCREGCTADLVTCYFIEVEYQPGIYRPMKNNKKNASSSSLLLSKSTIYLDNNSTYEPNDDNFNNETFFVAFEESENPSLYSESMGFNQDFIPQGLVQNGTLLININGCGYPPDVNCTEFERKFGELNTTFPCHFSQTNESIVVPSYSRRSEIMILSISLIVPLGTCLLCAILLYLLLRWNPKPKRNKKQKVKDKEPAPPATLNHVNDNASNNKKKKGKTTEDGKLRLSPKPNEKVSHGSKSMGLLSNIVGDLTGMSGQNVMHKRHYAKFSTSISNPNSEANSRKGSTTAIHRTGVDMELERIESAVDVKRISSTDDVRRSHRDLRKSITSTTFVDNCDDYYDVNEKKDSTIHSSLHVAMSNGFVPGTHPSPSSLDPSRMGTDDLKKLRRPTNDSVHVSSPSANKSSIWHVEGDVFPVFKNKDSEISPTRTGPYSHKKILPPLQKNSRRTSVLSMDSVDSDSVNTSSFGKL